MTRRHDAPVTAATWSAAARFCRTSLVGMSTIRSMGLAGAIVVSFVSTSALALERFSVRDSWSVTGLQAGWYWAMEKGLLAKNGIEITFEDGNGSGTTVQLINSGQFDIGHTDLSVMAIARGKGMKLTSIGGLIKKTSIGVFVPKGSNIKTPKDLEGKEVIYTPSSIEGPFMDQFLKNGGTSRDKVNLVSVDAAAKMPSYAAGKGDAMVTAIPQGLGQIEKARPSDYILFGDYGLDLPSYGIVVTEQTLKQRKPEALKALVSAYFEAWQQIIDGGESAVYEAATIIMNRRPDAKLDRDILMSSTREHAKYFQTPNTISKRLGYQSEQDWSRVISTLETAKLIPTGSKPADYFTNDFVVGSGQ